MDTPSKDDIATFIEVFNRLDKFEANTRYIRGWGEFKEEELPSEPVMRVMRWLESLTKSIQ